MEVIFRPSILNYLEHWQVFNDDPQILCFLHTMKELSKNQVNWQTKNQELEIEDLPNNSIMKGVVPLEIIFYRHDMYKGKPVVDQYGDVIEVNIGSNSIPRMIKIRKNNTLD